MSVSSKIEKIETRLKEAGLPVSRICEQAGIARSTWDRWRSGATSPNMSTWAQVEGVLEVALPEKPSEDAA